MATIIDDISRTFNEFLLLSGYTLKEHTPGNVNLRATLQRYNRDDGPRRCLKIPFTSAAMQSVSGDSLAVALSRKGGCSFIYCSQAIESQAEMVRKVKEHKAGFVASDSNLPPTATLEDAVKLRGKTGHSTIAVTADGTGRSKLLGLLTSKDFWEFKDNLDDPITAHFTPFEKLLLAQEGITLQEATEKLWKNKRECLPVIDKKENLHSLVFRRDYYDHKSNPDELTDADKRLFVGGAINTLDYRERARALVDAGVDCLCFDSSDGYTEWQLEAAQYLRKEYGKSLLLGGGNVVTAGAFRFLVEKADLDFVKVGIGGGSICITREQKGIGRGQASALIDVAAERDRYFAETGIYVPVCSDGSINNDTHIIIAIALGADFLMMGKYFAMAEESPTKKFTYRDRLYKPYWGEGANRARNWQRYKQSDGPELLFEEGVDAFVPYGGPLAHKIDISVAKLKAAMCNAGALSIKELHGKAVLTRVSELTIVESGTSTVEQLDRIWFEQG